MSHYVPVIDIQNQPPLSTSCLVRLLLCLQAHLIDHHLKRHYLCIRLCLISQVHFSASLGSDVPPLEVEVAVVVVIVVMTVVAGVTLVDVELAHFLVLSLHVL